MCDATDFLGVLFVPRGLMLMCAAVSVSITTVFGHPMTASVLRVEAAPARPQKKAPASPLAMKDTTVKAVRRGRTRRDVPLLVLTGRSGRDCRQIVQGAAHGDGGLGLGWSTLRLYAG